MKYIAVFDVPHGNYIDRVIKAYVTQRSRETGTMHQIKGIVKRMPDYETVPPQGMTCITEEQVGWNRCLEAIEDEE